MAVAHRLRCKACEPHTCPCGKAVDARGRHGLWCRRTRSGPRHQRHHQMNDVVWRAIKRAHTPAAKEPVSLMQQDGKRPDGTTLLPWTRGKPMAWDVTVPDTSTPSLTYTRQPEKHAQLLARQQRTRLFPVAVDTADIWNQSAIELIQEIGRRITVNCPPVNSLRWNVLWRTVHKQRITAATEDTRETVFLFQRLSIALQRGNAVAFLATFDAVWYSVVVVVSAYFNFHACGFVLVGSKMMIIIITSVAVCCFETRITTSFD